MLLQRVPRQEKILAGKFNDMEVIVIYVITCCRTGKFYHPNKHAKGIFVKSFSSLSDVALFMYYSSTLFYPKILSELTKSELRILQNKLCSIDKKHHITS